MREGARMLLPVEEEQAGRNIASRRVCPADLWMRWGRTIAIPSIGNQGLFVAEPRTGVDPGAGSVIRAVRGDLGDSRLAVCSGRCELGRTVG